MHILYTHRECPYAIRARMALSYAGVQLEMREVDLRQMPAELLDISPKGTVPVLQVARGEVLEQSMDIMHWGVLLSDPDGWMDYEVDVLDEMSGLVHINDNSFKKDLDIYRSWDEGAERSRLECRSDCELFLQGLEQRLRESRFLFGERVAFVDFAIFPFVRQFSRVEPAWFRLSPYPRVREWLAYHQEGRLFQSVMNEYPVWRAGDAPVLFRQVSA